jgi:hypothetical protein
MTDLHDWFRDRATAPSLTFDGAIEVMATHDRHFGPRWEHAEITVVITSAPEFAVALSDDLPSDAEQQGYARAVALGFLDVVMVHSPRPIRDVRLDIRRLVVDPVDSSAMAFRKAGQLAAEQLIAKLKQRPVA